MLNFPAYLARGWHTWLQGVLQAHEDRGEPQPAGERLCIYYSYPTGVNSLFSIERAAQLFSRYDIVVFSQPLQEPDHEEHANTVAVAASIHELNPRAKVFGYVSCAVANGASPALTDQEIVDQIDAWDATGVRGVLLDEFGFNYSVPRVRQNMAIDYCHDKDLTCLINAWVQADAFAPDKAAALAVDPFIVQAQHDTYNPAGIPSTIGAGDYSLLETWIAHTAFYPGPAHLADIFNIEARARHASHYRDTLGVRWLGSSQVNFGTTSDEDALAYMRLTEAFSRLFGADGWATDAHEYSAEPTAGNFAVVKPWTFDRRPQVRDAAPWIAGDFLTLNRQDLQLTLTGTSTAPGSAWTATESQL